MTTAQATGAKDRGRDHEPIRFAFGTCSLGAILVAATDEGVVAILLADDTDRLLQDLRARFPTAQLIDGGQALVPLVTRIVELVEMPARGLDLPLDLRGTAFQRRGWAAARGDITAPTVSDTPDTTQLHPPPAHPPPHPPLPATPTL